MQLLFSLSLVKLLWPFERIISYAHDQDHVHVHSQTILLHLEDSKYTPIHPQIKLHIVPWLFLSKVIIIMYRAIQKEIKDAYPKKICHIRTRHVKKKKEKIHTQRRYATCLQGMTKRKKERERKYSPYQNYYKGERNHMKEFHPSSTKNIHTLAHLDQGLWLISPLDTVFDLAKYEKQVTFISSIPTDPPKRSH